MSPLLGLLVWLLADGTRAACTQQQGRSQMRIINISLQDCWISCGKLPHDTSLSGCWQVTARWQADSRGAIVVRRGPSLDYTA